MTKVVTETSNGHHLDVPFFDLEFRLLGLDPPHHLAGQEAHSHRVLKPFFVVVVFSMIRQRKEDGGQKVGFEE